MEEPKRKFNIKSYNRRCDAGIVLYVKGVKRTRPRIEVYKMFQKSPEPISANEIIEYVNKYGMNINLATIYRILGNFEKSKLIRKVGLRRRDFYEIM